MDEYSETILSKLIDDVIVQGTKPTHIIFPRSADGVIKIDDVEFVCLDPLKSLGTFRGLDVRVDEKSNAIYLMDFTDAAYTVNHNYMRLGDD